MGTGLPVPWQVVPDQMPKADGVAIVPSSPHVPHVTLTWGLHDFVTWFTSLQWLHLPIV